MPRLLNGQTVQGVGATGISVNNQLVVSNAGSPGWVSPSQIVGNGPNGNAVITLPPSGPATNLWEPGASVVFAGAGTIAAGLQDGQGSTRLFNLATPEIPVTINGVIPFDVDRVTGAMIARPYQSGRDLWIWQTSNATQAPNLVIPTTSVYGARSVSGYICWTQDDSGTRRPYGSLYGQPVAIQARPGNIYNALLLPTPQGLWLLYTDQQGFIWGHPANDPSQGHTISQEGWGLDAEVKPDGSLLVAWCSNAGESAGSLQTAVWSLTDLHPFPSDPDPVPPDPEPEPPDPGPIPEPIPPVPLPGGSMRSDWVVSEIVPLSEPVTEVPYPQTPGLVGLKTGAGKYKTMNPGGVMEADSDILAPWQAFYPYGGAYLKRFTENPNKVYVVSRIPDDVPMP